MAEITLTALTKAFGNITAVDHLNLTIADGELLVLVGPSGCGKSTTLRLIAGLEDPTSGSILFDSQPVHRLPPARRGVAMVSQHDALYPHMSVLRNLTFPLTLRRIPRADIQRRALDAAAALHIEPLLNRKPGALSGGQRRRAALARAIVQHPRAFLFDEPLSSLDPTLRASTRRELKSLHQRLGTTTVHVTHDQEEAMALADRIAVMRAGRIHQLGSPLHVYHHPADRFVASFIGVPTMNFIDGALLPDADHLIFEERPTIPTDPTPNPPFRIRADALISSPSTAAHPSRSLSSSQSPDPPRLRDHVARPVVLGLRPQSLTLARDNTLPLLTLRVSLVEPLGEHADLTGTTPAGSPLLARLPASSAARPGDTLSLSVDPRGAFLFQPGDAGLTLI